VSYTVRLETRAERQLRALPDDMLRRVDAKLRALVVNPRPRGVKKLQGRKVEGWRVRVGDYRILYTIDDSARLVSVYRIDLRASVYRRGRKRR
jgi:mRNA interferase RelE/StbE